MNAEVTGAARAESRSTSLAFASVVVWLAAAASAGRLGIWLAIGGASVALGAAVLRFDRPAATTLLRPSATLVLAGALAGSLMAVATHLLCPALARLLPFLAPGSSLVSWARASAAPRSSPRRPDGAGGRGGAVRGAGGRRVAVRGGEARGSLPRSQGAGYLKSLCLRSTL